jgi:hypothetical protein
MTGRGAGYCAGYDVPGYANPVGGRGRGMARGGYRPGPGMGGRGRGWMNMYYATGLPGWARYDYPTAYPPQAPYQPSKEDEIAYLKDISNNLKKELELINERLDTLKSETKNKK